MCLRTWVVSCVCVIKCMACTVFSVCVCIRRICISTCICMCTRKKNCVLNSLHFIWLKGVKKILCKIIWMQNLFLKWMFGLLKKKNQSIESRWFYLMKPHGIIKLSNFNTFFRIYHMYSTVDSHILAIFLFYFCQWVHIFFLPYSSQCFIENAN